MPASDIVIKGAREHNLRDIDLVLPRNELICLTGVSGSGKSSLAFDTVFAEGQRRYVESLSSFARQFLGQMPKPDVDLITGLSPSVSISQKTSGNNPRSTVGTITEIYDYLRILFARVGRGFCPRCGNAISAQTIDQIVALIQQMDKGPRLLILAPLVRQQKGSHQDLFDDLLKRGYLRARVDGLIHVLGNAIDLDRRLRHDIEVVVDRLDSKNLTRGRLAEAVESAVKLGNGSLIVADDPEAPSSKATSDEGDTASLAADRVFSVDYACGPCGVSFPAPTPQMFSFNSPQGMCSECDGLGHLYSFVPSLLIPDDLLSFKKGCVTLVGKWSDLGRWRRHIYQGVADTLERELDLDEGTVLESPWQDLPDKIRRYLLYGTGDMHITFTWRGGQSPMKYGGQFEGIIPELTGKYRNAKSAPKRRQLEAFMDTIPCGACQGERLNAQARHVCLETASVSFGDERLLSLPRVCGLSIQQARDFFDAIVLDETSQLIATEALKEIRNRLGFLLNVGLEYLTLDRTAPTLSGGESQRIRLASQIGSGLVGVLYILDEPSIGLHARDNDRLIDTLKHLRDQGNTVLVVEHDEETMRAADRLIDFGPGPGVRGGHVVVDGEPTELIEASKAITGDSGSENTKAKTSAKRKAARGKSRKTPDFAGVAESPTVQFLSGARSIPVPAMRRSPDPKRQLVVRGARQNNLKGIDVAIPLGTFTCITGVSGSGKSSLVNDILVETLHRDLNKGVGDPGAHDAMEGIDLLDKLIAIDQSPIGRTPRSNPGTYVKVFDEIRKLFAQMPEAKRYGFGPGRFSFNVKSGRCSHCEGNGSNKLEMDFLADIWVTCPVCQGKRYDLQTLEVKFHGYSIADILDMEVGKGLEVFRDIPKVHDRLKTLQSVGLDYLKIGQPSPTLSGGEAQRIKLARELSKRSTGKTLYLLDEPTTGLHFADIEMLLSVLQNFVEAGNTVLVVEHNMDVIKCADWIIDLGPEGGAGGGTVVGSGTPEAIAAIPDSYTGRALRAPLGMKVEHKTKSKPSRERQSSGERGPEQVREITVRGACQHNLRGVDVQIARDEMTVFSGPSGSGKSSLAMDTIYAEGQRRYVESLSSYARQFVNQMQKPRVDHIEGLSPAIAIEQKNFGSTPRSTVGTVTEVYDYLRILFARLGAMHCPDCDVPVGTQTLDQIVNRVMDMPAETRLVITAPIEPDDNETWADLFGDLAAEGYVRVRVNQKTYDLGSVPTLNPQARHEVAVVIDRIKLNAKSRGRLSDSIEQGLSLGAGEVDILVADDDRDEQYWQKRRFSQHIACEQCGRGFQPLSPHQFSFNSVLGWCESCEGIGTQRGADPEKLLNSPQLSLREGAVSVWPDAQQPLAAAMLEALHTATGLPLDTPFEQLEARHRRLVLHGAGDQWFTARLTESSGNAGGRRKRAAEEESHATTLRFQYRGVFPSLTSAANLNSRLRQTVASMVGIVECGQCGGSRLKPVASAVRFQGHTIDGVCRMPLAVLFDEIDSWKLTSAESKVAGELLHEVRSRVQFLNDVGLGYLTLNRTGTSLSNGEAQRIRLAGQLGSGLCGVLYVLDEPTIGLHPRDNARLLKALHNLRDLGNTLLVVEHDRDVIAGADALCDFGPGSGHKGGLIVAQGTPKQVSKKRGSVTGPYLSGKKAIPIPKNRRPAFHSTVKASTKRQGTKSKTAKRPAAQTKAGPEARPLEIVGARHNNLKNINVRIPLGTLTTVTGPSGCGKSSLVNDILFRAVSKQLHRAVAEPGAHDAIRGIPYIDKVIRVDQQPLGNSPTSNPATYTGAFDLIRELYAQLPEAKLRGFSVRRFSFNVPGGRCEKCQGNGQIRIEMHFLPDVWVKCEGCSGQRYTEETLAIRYHGQSINDVLEMTCGDAVGLFANIPKIARIIQTLCDVGLDYLTLGQPAPTLSGGEAQRVKLAAELSRPDTGNTLYLLDEPTTGLHFDDLARLLDVLHRLVDMGNTVLLIEHNLDVIKSCDWVIDMGPEAGRDGGDVVVAGTPEDIVAYALSVANAKRKSAARPPSYTGEALASVLEAGPYRVRKEFRQEDLVPSEKQLDIGDVGRDTRMPWEADGRRWHTQTRVARNGSEIQWDGGILDFVVDTIEKHEGFSETRWNDRSVVEICGAKKTNGWFFHGITGEPWMLKLKFRCRRGTFKKEALLERFPLPTANQMEHLPIYGNTPRLSVATRGAWQEIEFRLHSMNEVDEADFRSFVEEAVAGFLDKQKRVALNLDDHTPWAALGQKWHFMRKGFPPGKRVRWPMEVLESVHEMLQRVIPDAQFLWSNKQVVHAYADERREPVVSLFTKKPEALYVELHVPKGSVPLGRVVDIGESPVVRNQDDKLDSVRLRFDQVEQVASPAFETLLMESVELATDSESASG